jgi:hypothetical protein
MTLLEWLKEREFNVRFLAADKHGEDRDGWLEDAEYFRQAALLAAADPLQGAVNWFSEALISFSVIDIQQRLLIGHNRAQRLFDAVPKANPSSRTPDHVPAGRS